MRRYLDKPVVQEPDSAEAHRATDEPDHNMELRTNLLRREWTISLFNDGIGVRMISESRSPTGMRF